MVENLHGAASEWFLGGAFVAIGLAVTVTDGFGAAVLLVASYAARHRIRSVFLDRDRHDR